MAVCISREQSKRERNKEIKRQKDKEPERRRDGETDRERDREAERQKEKESEIDGDAESGKTISKELSDEEVRLLFKKLALEDDEGGWMVLNSRGDQSRILDSSIKNADLRKQALKELFLLEPAIVFIAEPYRVNNSMRQFFPADKYELYGAAKKHQAVLAINRAKLSGSRRWATSEIETVGNRLQQFTGRTVAATIKMNGRTHRLVCVHPVYREKEPVKHKAMIRYLQEVSKLHIKQEGNQPGSVIVAGDFNTDLEKLKSELQAIGELDFKVDYYISTKSSTRGKLMGLVHMYHREHKFFQIDYINGSIDLDGVRRAKEYGKTRFFDHAFVLVQAVNHHAAAGVN